MRPLARLALLLGSFAAASPAIAGPPYETDDPEPTELGKWEIYAFSAIDGHRGDLDGAAGFDLNYGPVANVQLTATLPVGFAHVAGQTGWQSGVGDIELGVKYRFFERKDAGLSAAIFPRVILPTANRQFGTGRARLLLPLWVQKDCGAWSLFGGGGYQINPGRGNRDFWQAGAAVTRQIAPNWSIGGEVTRAGRDSDDAVATTSLGLGSIIGLGGPWSLLLSGGPRFSRDQTAYHLYAALGLNF